MALDLLENILEAEQSAQALVEDARQSASEILKAAEAAAREREREAAEEGRGVYKERLELARRKGEAALDEESAARRADIDRQMKQAASRVEKAAQAIVSEVLHGHR